MFFFFANKKIFPRIQIRLATKADSQQLSELFYEFYTKFNLEQTLTGTTKELLGVDDAKQFAQDTICSYFDDGAIILVAMLDHKIVGYIAGNIKNKSHYVYSPEGEIIDWLVSEKYRNQGVGHQLYQAFMTKLKSQNCKSVSLEAFYQNTKTIKTYERLGFVKDSLILKKKIE